MAQILINGQWYDEKTGAKIDRSKPKAPSNNGGFITKFNKKVESFSPFPSPQTGADIIGGALPVATEVGYKPFDESSRGFRVARAVSGGITGGVAQAAEYGTQMPQNLTNASQAFGIGLAEGAMGNIQGLTTGIEKTTDELLNAAVKAGGVAGSIGLSVPIAGLVGVAEGVSEGSAEKSSEFLDSAQQRLGGFINDYALDGKLDKTGEMAIVDGIFFGAGYTSYKSVKSKLSGEKPTSQKTTTTKPTSSGDVVLDAIDSHLSNNTSQFPEAPKVSVIDEIGKKLQEKAEASGRKLSSSDVAEVLTTTTGKQHTPMGEFDPTGDTFSTPVNPKISSILDSAIGESITLTKTKRKALLDELEKTGEIDRANAGMEIDSRLRQNRNLLDEVKVNPETKVQLAVDNLKLVQDVAKEGDTTVSKLKYEDGGLFKASNIQTLVENGIAKLDSIDNDTGLSSYRITEEGAKYFPPEVMKATDGLLYHIPTETMVRAESLSKTKSSNSFEVEANKSMDKVVTNPSEAAPVLNRMSEARGDAKIMARKSSIRKMWDDIKATVLGDETPPIEFRRNVLEVGKRLKIDTEKIFDWNGDINLEAYKKFADEVSVAEKFNFRNVNKLPNSTSLARQIKRDVKVSNDAFSQGKFEERVIQKKKIDILKEKLLTAVGEEKKRAYFQLKRLEEKFSNKDSFRKNLKDFIKSLKPDGAYKFYGDKASIAKLLAKFDTRIEAVATKSGFDKLLTDITIAIEVANKDALNAQISTQLKRFRNPSEATRKGIDPYYLTALRALATQNDRYFATMDSAELKIALDVVRSFAAEGRAKYFKDRRFSIDGARSIAESEKFRLREAGLKQDEGYVKQFIHGVIDNITFLKKIVNGRLDSPLYTRAMALVNSVKTVDLWKQKFAKEILAPLHKKGLLDDGSMGKLAQYALAKQGGWEASRIFNKDGDFIGQEIFKDMEFKNYDEYEVYMDEVNTLVNNTPELKNAYNFYVNLASTYHPKLQVAALIDKGQIVGYVDNYYQGRVHRIEGKVKDWSEIDTSDVMNRNFSKSMIEAREKGKRTYETDFVRDIHRFMDTEVRYVEGISAYNQLKSLIKDGGILDNLSKESQDVVKGIMEDAASPYFSKSNAFNLLSNLYGQNALALSLTSIVSQTFSLLDATLYVSPKNLAYGVKASFDGNAVFEAMKNSKALVLAGGFDFSMQEARMANMESSKFVKNLQRFNDWLLLPMSKLDMQTKLSVWMGAYKEFMEKKYRKPFDLASADFSNEKAIAHADDMMETAIGSKDVARVPPLMRNSYFRAAAMLQTFVIRRFNQIAYDLPRKFREDPVAGSKIVAAYALSTVLSLSASSAYNELLESLFGVQVGKYETFMDKLASMDDAEAADVLATMAVRAISGTVPLGSNVQSILQYGGTGVGAYDITKRGLTSSYKAANALAEGDDEVFSIEFLKAANTIVGGSPLSKTIQVLENN